MADPATALARARELVGTVIADRYRILDVIAMGGMGAVLSGEHVHMRRKVAIKVLHPTTAGFPGIVARFQREAIVGANVEHKNIASALDFGKMADGSHYLVLEFVRGATLRSVLRQGPMRPARAVRIARQIAAALTKLHARGIVHRDINPRNVMVLPGSKDVVKLLDFGFAKVPMERFRSAGSTEETLPARITADGVVFGTIGYLAPEAALGMAAVDARSDLYALGAMFYEMLSGQAPFDADDPVALFVKHRFDPLPAIAERAPDADVLPALEAIARRLLAKDPSDRFQRADELTRALDEVGRTFIPEAAPSSPDSVSSMPRVVVGDEPPPSLPRPEDVSDGTPPAVTEGVRPQRAAPVDEGSVGDAAADAEDAEVLALPINKPSRAWLGGVALALVFGGGFALSQTQAGRALWADAPSPPSAAPSVASSSSRAPAASLAKPAASPSVASSSGSPASSASASGRDADTWRSIVRRASATRDYARAEEGIQALGELDPSAFVPPEMRDAAVDVAVNASVDAAHAEKLAAVLASRFGESGLDVLYEVVAKRGGSVAANAAKAELAKPDVRARGTAAFRVALELLEASCASRLELLPRARAEGDERALAILVAIRDPDCDPSSGACCFAGHPAVETAVRELTEKVRAKK